MDLQESFSELVSAARDTPGLAGLRGTRALLASLEFADHLAELWARSHNDFERRRKLLALLLALKFSFRDQAEARREQHQHMHALALGGGSALVVGTVLAAATQAFAFLPLTLFPLAAGAYSAWRGSKEAVRLALEMSALNDIVDLLDDHIHGMQDGNLSQ